MRTAGPRAAAARDRATPRQQHLLEWAFAAVVGLTAALPGRSAIAQEPSPATYSARAAELEAYLDRHVLGVRFPGAVDREHGGFHVNYERDWKRRPDQDRFLVYEARLTWTAAKEALRRPDRRDEYLAYVKQGVAYLRDKYWDRELGGFRSFVRVTGPGESPENQVKLAYTNAFGVYALAAAYEATKDKATLALAQDGFRWIEAKLREEGRLGYLGGVARDGARLPFSVDEAEPRRDAMGAPAGYRGMNPHIHLLEAYAELLRVWPDPLLRQRTSELLDLARDRFFTEPGCLHLYLLPDGRPVPGPTSYGHDIETAFLLIEAAEALGNDDPRIERAARMLVDHTMAYGWNRQTGQIYDRGFAFEPAFDHAVQWWAMFEAANAMLLMHERHGRETPRYWEAFEKTWRFTVDKLTDQEFGGVYQGLDEQGKLNREKSGNWFASYHQARALQRSAERLRRLALAGSSAGSAGAASPAP